MAASWERLAAWEGGGVSKLVTANAADGQTVVFAATCAGVFVSDDSGLTWSPLRSTSGAIRTLSRVRAVLPSPRFAEDRTVFAGGKDGLYRWQGYDLGWEHLLGGSRIKCLAGFANASGTLTLLAGTEDDGILISRDSGRTWTSANLGLPDRIVWALAFSPAFDQEGLAFAGAATGLYRSSDGVASWHKVNLGKMEAILDDRYALTLDGEVISDDETVVFDKVAVSPTFGADRIVLANSYDVYGFIRSDDGGDSWTEILEDENWMINDIQFWSDGRVGVASEVGVAISENAGVTWRFVLGGPPWEGGHSAGCVALIPSSNGADEVLLVGLVGGGISRSTDGGQTWKPATIGLTATDPYCLAFSPSFARDQTLFLIPPSSGLGVSRDGGRTWSEQHDDGRSLFDGWLSQIAVAASHATGSVLYAATGKGLYISSDQAESWRRASLAPLYAPASESPFQEQVNAVAVAVAERDGGLTVLVHVATGRGMEWMLGMSMDGGTTWHNLETPLKQTFARGIGLAADGTIYVATHRAILPNKTDDLVVWRTTDRGQHWERWLGLSDMPGGSDVRLIPLPPNTWGDVMVVGINGRLLRPARSASGMNGSDGSPRWRVLPVPDPPSGEPPRIVALAASPAYAQDRTLFVATSAGVYVSRDGGETVSPWSDDLEPAAIVAITPSPAYAEDRLVYALGLGGILWRRRDA